MAPDDVRQWDYHTDYIGALEELGETPLVDAVVLAAFGGGKKQAQSFDLTSEAGKRALMREMENWHE